MDNNYLFLICSKFIFIFVRVLLIIYMVPMITDVLVDYWLKFFLSVLLSILVFSITPCAENTLFSHDSVIFLLKQVCIGWFLGIIIQSIFLFITYAGEILCVQIGLYNTNDCFSNSFSNVSIITKIFNCFLLLLFLSYDGHLWILYFIIKSFNIFPLFSNTFNVNMFLVVFKILHISFVNGITLIFPIIILLFLINILVGIMFRLSPYISRYLTGLSLFYFATIFFLFFFNTIFFSVLIFLLKKILHLMVIIFS
ncbi:flagellar biosynthetic protein FliR [Buchnera aphidicola]|uniref:Flagellar biosynthetic protein FliR n=1 Tax=Buchnera aphidicola (Sarucallis kahawaluokalani) TaxID=1241878 RepID=A0A4D6YCF4_9GAMM|nr:flagellar biosynthetic protein FliR [Buchnera aphidicola]QCI25863.1 hypothetical protein D9V78_00295 [Buchnera aphidicola (Sarucallis kahawaluokalani)]